MIKNNNNNNSSNTYVYTYNTAVWKHPASIHYKYYVGAPTQDK